MKAVIVLASSAPQFRLPRGVLVLCLALFFSGLVSSVPAQPAHEVQNVAEQVIRRLDLQTKLPTEPEAPGWTVSLPPAALWVVIAIALVVFLYALAGMLPFWRTGVRGEWSRDEAVPGDPMTKPPEVVLGVADDLAREGRHREAMHVLLLQGLADIRRYLGEQFADSLTSREILRHTRLSAAGRTALRDIIDRVEWTYFGQHPAAENDYLACRASFGALARVLRADGQGEIRTA